LHMRRPVVGIIGNAHLINDQYPAHAGGRMNSEAISEVSGCLPLLIPADPRLVSVAELLEVCKQQGTSLVLGGIFNSGILATGPQPGAWFDYAPAPQAILDRVSDLQTQAAAVGLTLPEAAIQFALHQPQTSSVLLGTGKVSSLQRNLEAAALRLTDAARVFVTT